MPPKRRVYSESDDEDDHEPDDSSTSKRARTEDVTAANGSQIRRSLRNGKGTGGWMAQMQNLERIQVVGKPKGKRHANLDALTQDQEVNPMAPISTPKSQQASRPQPHPRKPKSSDPRGPVASPAHESSTNQPLFALATPGQQFGFRLPTSVGDRFDSVGPSPPPSSRASSVFSGGVTHASTAPTSRTGSVRSSSKGVEGFPRLHSSHLQKLARASQAGMEAPPRMSLVSREAMAPKYPPLPKGVNSAYSLFDEEINEQDPSPQRPHPYEGVASAATLFDEPMDESDDAEIGGAALSEVVAASGDADTASRVLIAQSHQAVRTSVQTAAHSISRRSEVVGVSQHTEAASGDEDAASDAPIARSRHAARGISRHSGVVGVSRHTEAASGDEDTASDAPIVRSRHAARGISRHSEVVGVSHHTEAASGDENVASDVPVVRSRHAARDTSHRSEVAGISHHTEAVSGDENMTSAAVLIARSRHTTRTLAKTATPRISRNSEAPGVSHRSEGNFSREGSVVEDVVAVHRRRNRAPRLPNNLQLASVRNQQRAISTSTAVLSQREVTQPPETQTHLRAEHVRPGSQIVATEGADPSQLQFYEPASRDIIERAKQFSHCDAASVNSFPNRAEFNVCAVEYIEEAIRERRAQSLLVPDGWWPQYSGDICKLLWEDLGNWRSALRKRARVYVTQRYRWDSENRREENKEIAIGLLGDNGLFLRDGTDDEGRTNNFAHPALSGLVIDFFYSGDKSVGKLFPEVFETEVPRVTVAIAATALKVVLDEIASSQGEVNFRVTTYMPVYLGMLGLMSKCDTSAVHAAKTKSLRCKWAEMGSEGISRAAQCISVGGINFDVVLD